MSRGAYDTRRARGVIHVTDAMRRAHAMHRKDGLSLTAVMERFGIARSTAIRWVSNVDEEIADKEAAAQ